MNSRRIKLPNWAVLSFSPLRFAGTKAAPIIVEAPDATGQGLAVIGARAPSTFEHVVFKNLASPSHLGWDLPGAISFYESPFTFSECQFLTSRSEDFVNAIRSSFSITDSRFSHAHGDAVDSDFSDGSIRRSSFETCGNDAIDASGSVLELTQVAITGAGDKGISVGEASDVRLFEVAVSRSGIAIASKDLSRVRGKKLEIRTAKVGLSSYQKKPESGPAQIEVEDLVLDEVDLDFLIQPGSRITIDGESVTPAGRRKTAVILKRIQEGEAIN